MNIKGFEGDFHLDEATRKIYATDASAYRQIPQAVAIPKSEQDIIRLVNFASENNTSLIPRTAGTSLAGQVVGGGIVVDVSKHFNDVLEVNTNEKWAWVQPGIVRDDLNRMLATYNLFFAPETSTANRAMIGGMIGNNSCGSNSVVYGSTREHLLEVQSVLSDGTKAWFGSLDQDAFLARCNGLGTSGDVHANIYFATKAMLSSEDNRKAIDAGYPNPEIPRRNTGYALDLLIAQQPFNKKGPNFNFCSLLAGSEGTLAFITAAKIRLTDLPPVHKRLVAIHCDTIDESLKANLVALRHQPSACELMDHYILDATKRNLMYKENRFFLEGEPQAILVVELIRSSEEEVITASEKLIKELRSETLGYAFPVIEGQDMNRVWGLRKAGLGLLSNVPGDAKPAPVIEDTAVKVEDLPAYIAEFNQILKKYGLYSVHYAHAGSGELHLRPILNLKTAEGAALYRTIAEEIATLVKKYNGSLSGEHGDGRLRGEFIPQMLGQRNYELLKRVKQMWDPQGIFNPGKIVDTPPMDTALRFEGGQVTKEFDTVFDFSQSHGYLRAAEMCNGSGDCRKTELSGGTMCPSYMATRDEKDTTRARANILREVLTRSNSDRPFASSEIAEVMDLCLSCKGCKAECPSNVDMAKLKAEWQHQYHQTKGIALRSRLIGSFTLAMRLAAQVPTLYHWAFRNPWLGPALKGLVGFAPKRSMPAVSQKTLRKWFKNFNNTGQGKEVYFFCDEFTDYNDALIGQKAIQLLDRLGYQVKVIPHAESGRSHLSKGLLKQAKSLAAKNVRIFSSLISEEKPLIGLEPSTILTFRDEYISLLRGEDQQKARELAKNVHTIEEFLSREIDAKVIEKKSFKSSNQLIKVHGHCHQKALSSMTPTKKVLSFPPGHKVEMIPSGCCGMAGSFGYEKEHFDLSMKIGELILFPMVRDQPKEVIIAAAGTSCRHQIKDGTGRKALHPIEILYEALA